MSRTTLKKRKARPQPEFTRLRAETLSNATSRLFQFLILAICLAALVPALPQWNELKKIRLELEEVKGREASLAAKHEQFRSEEKALRENKFYLESRARDRLHLYREGERVIRIKD